MKRVRIANVVCHVLRWPEPNDFGHDRMTVLVRVETRAGVWGWGEAIAMWPEACRACVAIIDGGLAPLLIAGDYDTPEAAWAAMKAHTWWYGEGGIATFALSALDMALWDIAAKERGLPLVDLFGPPAHASLPVCASLHVNQPTIAQSVDEIAGHIAAGFRSAKLGLGKRGLSRAGRDPEYDVALVAALRAAIGGGPDIMVDAGNGTRWDLDTAIRTVRAMEASDITWIEEPFSPDRIADHVALRDATSTPVAAGEREWSEAGYRRWIDSGAVDVFGIDPGRAEGVTGFRRSAAAIEAAGKTVNAHAWSTAVLTAASLHLSLASSAARLFELKPLPGPMQFDLIDEPFWHQAGFIGAPPRAGHGAEPRPAILERYRA